MVRRSWMKYGLLAGMATVLAGGVAFAKGRGHCRHGGGFSMEDKKKFVTARIDDLLDEVEATEEQRLRIYASRDKVFAAFQGAGGKDERRGHMKRIAELFEKDRLELRDVQALRDEHRDKRQKVEDAIAEAVVEVHATLDAKQRKQVLEHVREIRRWRHGGED